MLRGCLFWEGFYVGKSFFAFKFFCLLLPFHLPVVYTLHWGVRDVGEILTGVAPSRPAPWRSACAGGVASHQEGNYEIAIRLLRIGVEHRMTKI